MMSVRRSGDDSADGGEARGASAVRRFILGDEGPDISGRTAYWALAVVLLVALALRLYGLDWDEGFDWTPHPDERAIMFKVVEISFPGLAELPLLLNADESPWNPRWFPYGSFPLYVLKFIGVFSEYIPGLDPNDLRIPGRAVSALADVATVALVYALGAMAWSRRVGLLASALTAVAVIHIQLSHFFAVDTLTALFCFATLLFLVRVARSGRLSYSLLAGVFLGLGLATKISVAPILAAYFVAHFMASFGLVGSDDSRDAPFTDRISVAVGNAVMGLLAIVATFLIAQPYALLDWGRFSADIIEQSEMVRRVRDYPYTRQYIDTAPYLYHIQQLSVWGLGLPLGIVAWAGTLYVAVRGLRIWWATGYLLVGICLPAAILMAFGGFAAILLASSIAVGALLVTIPVRSVHTRITALLLSWVVPYFLITGAFDVKFMRYMIPITPFLLLFGAKMASDIWRGAGRIRGRIFARTALGLVGALAFAATVFYAVSYLGIYGETHSAVRAGEWIQANVSRDSLILREHWDEGVPGLHGYEFQELELYNHDSEAKLSDMSEKLASADYILLYSNRLYGTIPRLPERYPVGREYYRMLFAGELGYELAAHFEAYPHLFGVGFADDTFGRPDLPAPSGLDGYEPYPATVNMGFADESFSVYDHPKLLLFRNESRLDSATIYDRILESSGGFPTGDLGLPPRLESESDRLSMLMLTPEQSEARQAGGTWTDIINPNRRADWVSVTIWLVVAQAIALISFPLAFVVFRPLADRGWLFSKGLGLLIVGLIVWLLSSLELMAFTRTAVIVGTGGLLAVSAALLILRLGEIRAFFREHWKAVLIGELVFLVAFGAFIAVRMANPDLWHPFRGGEKPMDMAYLNAVVKSAYMPPYDPWFGGGYINYYYWGQFLVGTLIHATGIAPEIALNLAVPLFFAMTAAFSYSVAYNLARGRGFGGGASPVVAGLLGALFVVVLGNLDGAIQLGQGAWRSAVEGLPMGEFDFWRSSRMMPPDPPGHEITEFPFFTFLFADPHAHLWALPFTVLCIGISAAVALGMASRSGPASFRWAEDALRIVILGIAVGALRLLNTWDYPTYLLLGAAAIVLGEYLAHGGLSSLVILRTGVKSALVFVVGYVAFLPYHLSYETFFSSVERTTNTTPLWQFLAISGVFVFVIGSFYLWELRGVLAAALSGIRPRFDSLLDTLSERGTDRDSSSGPQVGPGTLLVMIGAALAAGYLLTALLYGYGAGGTIIFGGALLGLIGFTALRALGSLDGEAPVTLFASLMAGAAFALVVGLDVFRVEGDIERMNSVFKFYLQVWVLLALASAYMVWRLLRAWALDGERRWEYGYAWAGALAVLVVCAAVYPVLGTQDRLRDRFNGNVTPMTLDGLAYIEGTVYNEPEGPVDLAADFEGIRWLRENVEGSPIVLEANTPTYRWGGRVSIYTGLPSVVGWQWHQEQQRWDYRQMVAPRIRDVELIYSTEDISVARELLAQYEVKYIYVGQLERSYYSAEGIAKFDSDLSPYVSEVFHSDEVAIYEVLN